MSIILGNSRGRLFFVVAVLVLSAITAGWKLSADSLNDHECFVSVTAREMLDGSNWILPEYNGQPRLQKTPLLYWLVAGLAKITGRVDEFTARLPSAVFAVFSVAVMIYFVSQFLSFRIALVCAAVWATSLGYIRYAHSARPDMALTFFITVCFLSFYAALITQSHKKRVANMVVFWVCFGLANLAKGPEPIPLILIPLFFYIAIFRHWKQVPKLLPVWGVLIFLVITLAWPIAVAWKVNWDIAIWKREFIDRFLGQYAKGNYPVYFYFLIMFKYITPWVVFLPMALAAPFYRVWGRKQPVMQFLWLWFVVDFAFLTLSGGKRQQYIMPVMPSVIILTGILLEDIAFVREAYTRRFAANFLKAHIIVIVTAAAAVVFITLLPAGSQLRAYIVNLATQSFSPSRTNPQLPFDIIMLCTAAMLAAGVVAVMFAKMKPVLGCSTVFISIVIWVMISYVRIVPMLDSNRFTRDFALKVTQIVPQSGELVAPERMCARFLHYFGRVVPHITDKSVLYQDYQNGAWVVATGKQMEELARDGRFRRVYYNAKEEFSRGEYTAGALFNNSAPIVGEAG